MWAIYPEIEKFTHAHRYMFDFKGDQQLYTRGIMLLYNK